MQTQPTPLISFPASLPVVYSGTWPVQTLLLIVLGFVVVYWMFETIISIYHWWVYAHSVRVGVPAVSIHLGVSLVLILFTLSGLL